jgi:predicted Zn-dependent protease
VEPRSDTPTPNAERDLILSAMQAELDRSVKGLRLPGFEPPLYLGFRVDDDRGYWARAEFGVLASSAPYHNRQCAVDARVGSHSMDNTRPGEERNLSGPMAQEDDLMGLRTALWDLADDQYKLANRDFYRKKAYLESRSKEGDRPDDFSEEKPPVQVDALTPWDPPISEVEHDLKAASLRFRGEPALINAGIEVSGACNREFLCDSEGGKSAGQGQGWFMTMNGKTQAQDGSPLNDEWKWAAPDWAGLPHGRELLRLADRFAGGLMDLRKAKEQEPASGPVLLEGQASAVFLHQVLGHLLAGENQKDENADQSLKDKLGEKILPAFLSLTDDPRPEKFGETVLMGHYDLDDQGIPAQEASLVKDGKLTGFLLSRSLAKGFRHSNGHGRGDADHTPTGRLGVLKLDSRLSYAPSELKNLLVKECRRQGKPFGFLVRRLFEGEVPRSARKAFRLQPAEIYRVSAADGKETLVRGVELVGTPLNALGRIRGTGDQPFVLNTFCDYASGEQAISVITPSLLFSELELQKKDSTKTRLKILKPPFADK